MESARWLAFASCAFLVASLPGCNRKTDAEATPPSSSASPPVLGIDDRVHPIGELGHARDYSMSVESVGDCPMAAPFAAKPGFVKVGVEVSLEGTSSLEVPANPFYAELADATGTYASTLAGCEPGLAAVRLTSGVKARGFVSFEIPKESRKLELRYAPIVIGPGKEELKFLVVR